MCHRNLPEMKFDRFANFCLHLFRRVADRYAARQIRNIGGIVPLAFLDHDGYRMGSFLEAGLPEDALQRARSQIRAELARHGG